jgi:hypothetical protein
MFDLDHQSAKLTSVTAISEFKGDTREPACSMKFEITTNNLVLVHFDSKLRQALYTKAEKGAQPSTNDMFPDEEMGDLVALKFHRLGYPLKWDLDLAGYELTFHIGLDDEKSNIALAEIKLSDFAFTPKDGGTVITTFKAYAKPSALDQGRIDQLLQQEVEISLVPPAPASSKQPDLIEEGKKRGRKKAPAEKPSDPFHGSDLATDGSAPENAPEGEQVAREGVSWPFPNPGQTHDEGEAPTEGEPETADEE